jgi:hypothetical protein
LIAANGAEHLAIVDVETAVEINEQDLRALVSGLRPA